MNWEKRVMNTSAFRSSFIGVAATLIVAAGTMLLANLASAAPARGRPRCAQATCKPSS